MTNAHVPEARTLDDVLDGLRFAMVTTMSSEGMTARPLTVAESEGGVIRFLVSAATEWVKDLHGGPGPVQVAFAEPKDGRYIALTGTARVSTDRALVERLWSAPAKAFFTGPDDPDAVALEVEVRSGEWWDAPDGRVGRAIGMLRAVITRDGSKVGDSGIVTPN